MRTLTVSSMVRLLALDSSCSFSSGGDSSDDTRTIATPSCGYMTLMIVCIAIGGR